MNHHWNRREFLKGSSTAAIAALAAGAPLAGFLHLKLKPLPIRSFYFGWEAAWPIPILLILRSLPPLQKE